MLTKEGIIIKSNKYQETSKLVHVLTSDGLKTYLVRGANNFKSKNYAYSLELTKIQFESNRKNTFDIITLGKVEDNYTNIKTNTKSLYDTIEIFELVYSLSDHVIDTKILYSFLSNILDSINNHYHEYYLTIFKLKLLYLLGVGPDFKGGCAKCQKSELYAYDLEIGKAFCKECFSMTQNSIYADEFEVFRFLYLMKFEHLTKEVLDTLPKYQTHLDEFLDRYYDYYLGYKSKSKRIINKM